ncbi:MAG: hypothetical protein ACK5WG_13400, partial [Betaproteobacteria bacterium]
MTDRKMLELAAKAAGYSFKWGKDWHDKGAPLVDDKLWNPLDDDGDNRRLQVDLKIELIITDQSANACFDGVFYSEPLGKGARKAARRAVVRAAV